MVLDIATLVFDETYDMIDTSDGATVRLYHSYSYYDKLGQVWDESNREWITKVDIETKQWFRHEFASYSLKEGYTNTDSFDFTPNKGYKPIHQDYKPHWDDNQWIQDTAFEYYINNRPTYVDAWTH